MIGAAVLIALVLLAAMPALNAAAQQPLPENARARTGPDGGAVTVRNVRLVLPARSSAGPGFLALGVGGVVPPHGLDQTAGDTGVLVSVSPGARGPLLVEIQPSAADLRAADGERSRLALVDTATGRFAACRVEAPLLHCLVAGPGTYIVAATDSEGTTAGDWPPATTSAPSSSPVVALAAGAVTFALLVALLTLCLFVPGIQRARTRKD
jgi:hypothetical protein